MDRKTISGAALAAAAAMILSSGVSTFAFAADAAKVKCEGVNSCKGSSECKSADNSCKGMNTCKGHGWVTLTDEECTAAKAKVAAEKPAN
jgi:uncharacterized membrane protein